MSNIELMALANSGGSISISATDYSVLELMGIARSLNHGAKLYLKNARVLPQINLLGIANSKPGFVVFEF